MIPENTVLEFHAGLVPLKDFEGDFVAFEVPGCEVFVLESDREDDVGDDTATEFAVSDVCTVDGELVNSEEFGPLWSPC